MSEEVLEQQPPAAVARDMWITRERHLGLGFCTERPVSTSFMLGV